MQDYWHSHYANLAIIHEDSPLKQVQKTVNGEDVGQEQIALIVKQICATLNLTSNDSLIDLCCGNGVVTVQLADHVGTALGIDYTEAFLNVARQRHTRSNPLCQYQLRH